MKTLVLGVRFACELAAVAGVVWWGWPWLGIVGGAAVVVIWGAWVAPKARRRLADPVRLVIELAIFAGATAGFISVGQTGVGIVFAVAAVGTAFATRPLEGHSRT
jgi:hypothetical protein